MSELSVRVYFEDTDFSGRVYHGAYVRFLERGRTEHLRAGGLDHRALADGDPALFFTLRRLDIRFTGAAGIDDLLTVRTALGARGRASVNMLQTIVRDDAVIVRAAVELCVIDESGRPRRLPGDVVRAIETDAVEDGRVDAATVEAAHTER